MSSDRIDFNDLLKWFINLTPDSSEAATISIDNMNDSTIDTYIPKKMSQEDQEFLLSAMDSHVMDEQKRVKLLLRVMRLPQSPLTLHHLSEIEKLNQISATTQSVNDLSDTTGFSVLNDKYRLRSLLEMRKEDQKRREMGIDIIGHEYIPSSLMNEEEVLKRTTLESQLAILRNQLANENNIENNDTTDTTDTSNTVINIHENNDTTDTSNTVINIQVPEEILFVNPLDSDGDELSEEQIRRKRAQQRYKYLSSQVEKEIQTTLTTMLCKLSSGDTIILKKLYNQIREEKLDALNEIEDRTYRSDNAVGFVSYNGIQILKNYLLGQDFEIAASCWKILGNIVSNQSFCQGKAVEFGLIPYIIEGMNITRYLPSILAHHFFYNFLPSHLDNLKTDSSTQNDVHIIEIERLLAQYTPIETPQNHIRNSPIKLTPQQYQNLLSQYFHGKDNIPSISNLIPILSKYTHFGATYLKFIFPLIKSILFFTAALLNNFSTAQTQFLQYNGLISLSYLLELGALQISTIATPNVTTDMTPVIDIFLQLFAFNESVSNQTIRRVFQIILSLIDEEYEISTSYEIFQALFSQVQGYQQLQHANVHKIAKSLVNFTPTPFFESTQATAQNNLDQLSTSVPLPPSTIQKDEGKPLAYFSAPIAPFRLQSTKDIHPSFKLQNNRVGGVFDNEGEHVEKQIPLAPIASLLVIFSFPFPLWTLYFNANNIDRVWVLSSQRVVAFISQNHYQLTHFDPNDEKCVQSRNNQLEIQQKLNKLPTSWKISSILHQILIEQAKSMNIGKTIDDGSVFSTKVLGFIDNHIKSLTSRIKGTKLQQDEQRQFNREELQYLSQIKSGLIR